MPRQHRSRKDPRRDPEAASGWLDGGAQTSKPGLVTVDMGESEIPTGTLRNIYRAAEWEW
jgi:hypothetical protein